MNGAKLARFAILAAPLLLGGCDTVNSIKSDSIAWVSQIDINLPWKKHEALAKAEPGNDTTAPVQIASEPAVLPAPEGLQPDDLRAPFGADGETAVASRSGL
jgi:hypothetical protein